VKPARKGRGWGGEGEGGRGEGEQCWTRLKETARSREGTQPIEGPLMSNIVCIVHANWLTAVVPEC
jgi:hypothetical protein